MTLNELVKKSGTPELSVYLKALEQEAEFGRRSRETLLNETVSLGLLLDFGGDEQTLRKAFSALDNEELTALKQTMAKKSAALFPAEPQLPLVTGAQSTIDNAYMI